MKNLQRLIFGLACSLLSTANAQQQSVFTNVLANPLQYSPAYVGSTNYHEISFYNRLQWVGFKDSPRNFYLNFHGSYKNKAKHGYGIQLSSENVGIVSKTAFYLNYAYQIKFNKNWHLGLGVRPGFVQYRMRFYEAVIADEGDFVFSGNTYSGNAIDVNAGFRLYSNKFEFSGAIDHLIGRKFNVTSYNQNLQWHYNFMTSYKFQFKKHWEVRPAVMVRSTQHIPAQVSIMLQGSYQNRFILGLAYRSSDAFGFYAGWRFKDRLSISYGYDYSYTAIRKYNGGSHEIGISFILTKNRPSLEEEDDKLNNSILEEIQKEMEKNK